VSEPSKQISTKPLLRIENLQGDHFGPVSLNVSAHECVALYGPSGSGKSQFLRAITDLDPNQGTIRLNGKPRGEFLPTEWRKRVGLLPAESRWWSDTVGDHFNEPVDDDLAALGLDERIMEWPVSRLSSGERHRLALLRLLGNRPRVLLLDEPTANLDPRNTRRVEVLVEDYIHRTQGGAIWVSHDFAQIENLADKILRFENGLPVLRTGQ
jgi:UDP-glucose/iron transport system ATP-binding protein